MSTKRLAGIGIMILFLFMGCAGNYGIFKRKTGSESKATRQELIDNWSDYDIWLHYDTAYEPPRLTAIVFDTNNDGKKILVESNDIKVTDQEMWLEIVKEYTTSDGDPLVWGSGTEVIEIWGPENQLYGILIHTADISLQRVEQVDKNSMRVSWIYLRSRSNPGGW